MRRDGVRSAVMLASVPAATAQWWGGAPECAIRTPQLTAFSSYFRQQSCLSSAWSAAASPSTTITSGSSTITPAPWNGWGPGGSGGYWPAQSDYCDAGKASAVNACVNSACTSTLSSLFASYTSLSSSLCSRYESCLAADPAAATAVQTITFPAGPVTWAAPGGWGPGGGGGGPGGPGGPFGWKKRGVADSCVGHGGGGAGPHGRRDSPLGGPGGSGGWGGPPGAGAGAGGPGPWAPGWGVDSTQASSYWSEWASAWSAGSTATWSGATVTVTGAAAACNSFAGSPWFVGPGGGWNGAGGFNGWIGWGSGWSWGPTTTVTQLVTTTGSGGSSTVATRLATLALAVSGDFTTGSTVGAAAVTGAPNSGSGAAPAARSALVGGDGEGSVVTRMCAVAALTVFLLVGLL
ncbi:uncharacterized protein B0I36DRAFT_345647 [Microdochium trichocladiopsis]|uniref:Extracellular membrane protein CFEM domain-containing protein n=1 Tax=Microdochium trichocladiopsis TaxID=1682393 RepID=A0A9P8YE36_9PEZI|nr:uncharacterized protein B0I36DRAFT_345647 [Microdochium trichocladiopsis]KAH7037549.1 hypothetical protein B0I36DRAFT_345647 [Microdochium trichocladiopsis]